MNVQIKHLVHSIKYLSALHLQSIALTDPNFKLPIKVQFQLHGAGGGVTNSAVYQILQRLRINSGAENAT